MPVTSGGTNIPGDSARLFPWQMVHYLVHGGPNDPVLQTNSPPTNLGYLSWNSVVTLPPLPGTQTPPAVPLPRVQSIGSTGTAGASVTNNTGGIYIGTIPQGAWIESIECQVYAAFTTGTSFGVYFAPAGSFTTTNVGFQPANVWQMASFTGTGAAGTMYSTEFIASAAPRAAWSAAMVGPGVAPASFGQTSLASVGDIDLYFIVFTVPTAGSASVRVKFTGLEG